MLSLFSNRRFCLLGQNISSKKIYIYNWAHVKHEAFCRVVPIFSTEEDGLRPHIWCVVNVYLPCTRL